MRIGGLVAAAILMHYLCSVLFLDVFYLILVSGKGSS